MTPAHLKVPSYSQTCVVLILSLALNSRHWLCSLWSNECLFTPFLSLELLVMLLWAMFLFEYWHVGNRLNLSSTSQVFAFVLISVPPHPYPSLSVLISPLLLIYCDLCVRFFHVKTVVKKLGSITVAMVGIPPRGTLMIVSALLGSATTTKWMSRLSGCLKLLKADLCWSWAFIYASFSCRCCLSNRSATL